MEALREAIVDKTYYLKEHPGSCCLCTEITSIICVFFIVNNSSFPKKGGALGKYLWCCRGGSVTSEQCYLPRSPPFTHTSHLCSPRSLQVEERSTTLATSCQPSVITGSTSLCLPLKTIPVTTLFSSSQHKADTETHQWKWRGENGSHRHFQR